MVKPLDFVSINDLGLRVWNKEAVVCLKNDDVIRG